MHYRNYSLQEIKQFKSSSKIKKNLFCVHTTLVCTNVGQVSLRYKHRTPLGIKFFDTLINIHGCQLVIFV